ncbi:MAG: hypothetical protein J7K57_03355, partial [Palaeococcus sp.]|nr:hypothetical protein [Palaeococcus sp. (in: euryarchaeotes)]
MVVKKTTSFLAFFFISILLIGYLSFHTSEKTSQCLSNENKILPKEKKSCLIGFPKVYSFEWGFIGVKNTTLQACTYSRELLWSYDLNSTRFMISPSEEDLFVFVPANVSPGMKGNDTLYVFSRDGLVEEFSFSNIYYPMRCAFLKSRGNYTLFILDQPQADGTAGVGRVLIFRSIEVIFNRTFTFRDSIEDPVYCVGDISGKGIAAFGLYQGIGIFNGSLRYVELPPYGADDIAVVGRTVFVLVQN